MNHMTAMAEQQLLGWCEAKQGTSLIGIVNSMGLKKKEWETIKKEVPLVHMREEWIKEIDEHFENESTK